MNISIRLQEDEDGKFAFARVTTEKEKEIVETRDVLDALTEAVGKKVSAVEEVRGVWMRTELLLILKYQIAEPNGGRE